MSSSHWPQVRDLRTLRISQQAVTADTPVLGTSYTADQIATSTSENNYNCGGMAGLDCGSPGTQAYVNSIVDELASWDVDYVKLDGITDGTSPI
jgi:alpha-galactosidase